MTRGGKREGAGRKTGFRKETTRSVRKGFRLTPGEDATMKEALAITGISETDLVRTALDEKVAKILKKGRG